MDFEAFYQRMYRHSGQSLNREYWNGNEGYAGLSWNQITDRTKLSKEEFEKQLSEKPQSDE